MTTNTIDRQLVWVVLAIIAALIIVPLFGMMWAGPMMGGMWGTGMWGADGMSGWMLIIGVGMQLLFVAVIAGAVYLGYRATRKGMTHLTLQSRSFGLPTHVAT